MQVMPWALTCCLTVGCSAIERAADSLQLEQTIALPLIKGGFDLMAADVAGHRLFVAAEDNDTVEVLDLVTGRPTHSIAGFSEPKWIVFQPETSKLYVANGGDGTVSVLDSETFHLLQTVRFEEKANNLRYDPTTALLYVGVGKSFGAIGIIDTRTDSAVDEIRLDAFPKQFELERAGKRVFVNVPSLNQVAVLDRGTGKQFASWPLAGATGNVPMALDEPDRRLLIGCEPGAFIVLDTETGRPVAHLGIAAKPDGVYLDARRRLIYVSCGTGFIEVIRQLDADHYAPMRAIPTSPGAATSLWVPQLDRLFLGVPQQGDRPASIRVYCPVR